MIRRWSVALVCASSMGLANEGTLLSDPKLSGEVRVRYENVDVDPSTLNQANGYTVRVKMNVDVGLLGVSGLRGVLEGTGVRSWGNYNSGSNGLSTYEVIKDPETTRLSQAYVGYTTPTTTIKGGVQTINLDNQRFVGSVDWREMMQSFQALSIKNSSIDRLSLFGAYVWGVRGITDSPTAQSKSLLLNGAYRVNDGFNVTMYEYMISSKHDTYGVALTGKGALGSVKMDYRLEAAHQQDPSLQSNSHDSNAHADASYYTAELTTNTLGLIIGGGYEVLGAGDGGTVAFATPWATLHKFNGWDDKFLTTPTGGLKDASATLGYTHPMMGKAIMVYHEFRSDTAMSGKENLGKEWDMLYTKDIAKGLNALIKAAYYEHGDVSGYTKDTRKVWIQLDYTF